MTAGWNATQRELEILELRKENQRLRGALKEIAYYDDFLDAEAAKNMLAIARDALAGVVEGGGQP